MRRLLNLGSVRLASFAPLVREQVSNLAAGHRGRRCRNVGEVFLRIDPVTAAALDDSVNDGATPTGIRMPDKEPAALSDGRGPTSFSTKLESISNRPSRR